MISTKKQMLPMQPYNVPATCDDGGGLNEKFFISIND